MGGITGEFFHKIADKDNFMQIAPERLLSLSTLSGDSRGGGKLGPKRPLKPYQGFFANCDVDVHLLFFCSLKCNVQTEFLEF